MQLNPPLKPALVRPIGLLLVQPSFYPDALYPPQVLKDGKVRSPDRVVGKLDESSTGEILAESAAFKSPLSDAAAVDGAGRVMRSRCTLATIAATTVTDLIQ